MTLDSSAQGFCYQLPDLSAWPDWASRSQGHSWIPLCVHSASEGPGTESVPSMWAEEPLRSGH